jgi:hypothetical protein
MLAELMKLYRAADGGWATVGCVAKMSTDPVGTATDRAVYRPLHWPLPPSGSTVRCKAGCDADGLIEAIRIVDGHRPAASHNVELPRLLSGSHDAATSAP